MDIRSNGSMEFQVFFLFFFLWLSNSKFAVGFNSNFSIRF